MTPPRNRIAGPCPSPDCLIRFVGSHHVFVYSLLSDFETRSVRPPWDIKVHLGCPPMLHQILFSLNFYHCTLVMFSKLFALSTLLGLLAALPANAAEIEVVAGGPDGLIQYNPSFVVGPHTASRLELLNKPSSLDCQPRRCHHVRLQAEEPHRDTVHTRHSLFAPCRRIRHWLVCISYRCVQLKF